MYRTQPKTVLRRSIATSSLIGCIAASIGACGTDKTPSPPASSAGTRSFPDQTLTGTDVDAGAGAGGNSGMPPDTSTEDAGSGLAPDGGETEQPVIVTCGNGQTDPGEQCDGNTSVCTAFGFDFGEAVCSSACQWDVSGCTSVEQCSDGRDNDGDSYVDCADSDCSAACQDACLAPDTLPLNSTFSGTTAGRTSGNQATCSDEAGGATVVYRIETDEIARLDLTLASAHDLTLSVAYDCGDTIDELECGSNTRLSMNVEEDEVYFVTVQGETTADVGEFRLQVSTRQPYCGDRFRDEQDEETCDDGNSNDGDGCDPDCALETTESEPGNDNLGGADALDAPAWFAQIRPAGDEDYYRLVLTEPSSNIVVETRAVGDSACAFNLMDTVVDILDTNANGNALLASDDDGGEGRCSRATAEGLPAGTYYLRVAATAQSQPNTFPYELDLQVTP